LRLFVQLHTASNEVERRWLIHLNEVLLVLLLLLGLWVFIFAPVVVARL